MEYILPETNLLQIKGTKEDKENKATFILEPLSPGYGMTIGNSLRRVLLSSLEGAAISSIHIEGIAHEFSTLPGVKEDIVEIILNLKGMRLKLHGDEPTTIILEAKKGGEIKAKDFKENPQVEIIDPEHHIATLDSKGKLILEAMIEKGRGYIPTELKRDQKLPMGTISVDSIFTPVRKVHYEIENTRVGRMTNFDKLTLEITTDGTVSPQNALQQAAQILVDHFNIISETGREAASQPTEQLIMTEGGDKKSTKKTSSKPKTKASKAKSSVKSAPKKKTAKK